MDRLDDTIGEKINVVLNKEQLDREDHVTEKQCEIENTMIDVVKAVFRSPELRILVSRYADGPMVTFAFCRQFAGNFHPNSEQPVVVASVQMIENHVNTH